MIEEFWISCPKMTVWVKTKDRVIVDSASIVWKFQGQPLSNLLRWLSRFGEVKKYKLVVGLVVSDSGKIKDPREIFDEVKLAHLIADAVLLVKNYRDKVDDWYLSEYDGPYHLWGKQKGSVFRIFLGRFKEKWVAEIVAKVPEMLRLLSEMAEELDKLKMAISVWYAEEEFREGKGRRLADVMKELGDLPDQEAEKKLPKGEAFLCPDCWTYAAKFWENPNYDPNASEDDLDSLPYKWCCVECGDFGYLKEKLDLYRLGASSSD